ncbi:MAG TPA: NAD(P)/FAD-dependent oxidoreductase [Bacillota bacterium]|nr:NAD(P)/FAD-dependent oxidoreductase [Bacillota bacterium]
MDKIAVLGGGPAGLSAAIEGAKCGLAVTLFEKSTIGEKISCAEGFFDTLNMLGQPKYGVKYKVREILVQMNSCYTFPCDDKMNIWMLDKGEWQKGLAEEARSLGVTIMESHPISPAMLNDFKTQFDWVIDASGPFSLTSKAYGFNRNYTDTSAVCAQYVLAGDFSHLAGRLKIGMEESLPGYFWIFPKSNNEANVGICSFAKLDRNYWRALDGFLEREGIAGYAKLKKAGGLCPVQKLERLVYDNILLVGDAAGLVSPLHAAGIDTACISGKLAVQAIAGQKVSSYEKMINNALLKKMKADKKLYDLWQLIGYNYLENATDIVANNPEIKVEYSDLFNGNFNLFKNLKYLRYLPYLKDFIRNARLLG